MSHPEYEDRAAAAAAAAGSDAELLALLVFPQDDVKVIKTVRKARTKQQQQQQQKPTNAVNNNNSYLPGILGSFVSPLEYVVWTYKYLNSIPRRTVALEDESFLAEKEKKAVKSAFFDGDTLNYDLMMNEIDKSHLTSDTKAIAEHALAKRMARRSDLFHVFSPEGFEDNSGGRRSRPEDKLFILSPSLTFLVNFKRLQIGSADEIEPFFCSVAVYDITKRKKISETFYFHHNSAAMLQLINSHNNNDEMVNSKCPTQALFSLAPGLDSQYYLVLRVEKIIQPHTYDEAVDAYGKVDSSSSQLEKLKKTARDCCQRLSPFRQMFAWGAVNLSARPDSSMLGSALAIVQSSLESGAAALSSTSASASSASSLPIISAPLPGSSNVNSVNIPNSTSTTAGNALSNSIFGPAVNSTSNNNNNKLNTFRLDSTISEIPLLRYQKDCSDGAIFDMIADLRSKKIKQFEKMKLDIEIKEVPADIRNSGKDVQSIPGLIEEKKLGMTADPSMDVVVPSAPSSPATSLSSSSPKPVITLLEVQDLLEVEVCTPSTHVVNNLYIYPEQINFTNYPGRSANFRNLVCRIQVKDNDNDLTDGGLPVIYARYSNGTDYLTSSIVTQVLYHNKHPVLGEEIKIKLPFEVTKQHHILFTFFHIVCKIDSSSPPVANSGSLNKSSSSASVSSSASGTKKDDGNGSGYLSNTTETFAGFAICPLLESGSLKIISDERKEMNVSLPPPSTPKKYLSHWESTDEHTKVDSKDKRVFIFSSRLVSSIHPQNTVVAELFARFRGELSLKEADAGFLQILKRITSKEVDRFTAVKFSTLIINLLLRVITYTASNETREAAATALAVFVDEIVHIEPVNNSNFNGGDNRHPVLQQYVELLFTHQAIAGPGNESHPNYTKCHEVLVKTWLGLLRLKSPTFYSPKVATFLFDIIIKSMVLHLHATDANFASSSSSTLHWEGRFADPYATGVRKLCDEIYEYIWETANGPSSGPSSSSSSSNALASTTAALSVVENKMMHLNVCVSQFVKALFSLMDREKVFYLVKTIMNKETTTELQCRCRCKVLQVLCDHEHYAQLNLPIMPTAASISPVCDIEEKFYREYVLIGYLLNEVSVNLSKTKTYIQTAMLTLAQVLHKHDWDSRYDQPSSKQRIAAMYFPYLLILIDKKHVITIGDDHNHNNSQPQVAASPFGKEKDTFYYSQCMLICTLWIIKNIPTEMLRQWWTAEENDFILVEFLDILHKSVVGFTYDVEHVSMEYVRKKEKNMLESKYKGGGAGGRNLATANATGLRAHAQHRAVFGGASSDATAASAATTTTATNTTSAATTTVTALGGIPVISTNDAASSLPANQVAGGGSGGSSSLAIPAPTSRQQRSGSAAVEPNYFAPTSTGHHRDSTSEGSSSNNNNTVTPASAGIGAGGGGSMRMKAGGGGGTLRGMGMALAAISAMNTDAEALEMMKESRILSSEASFVVLHTLAAFVEDFAANLNDLQTGSPLLRHGVFDIIESLLSPNQSERFLEAFLTYLCRFVQQFAPILFRSDTSNFCWQLASRTLKVAATIGLNKEVRTLAGQLLYLILRSNYASLGNILRTRVQLTKSVSSILGVSENDSNIDADVCQYMQNALEVIGCCWKVDKSNHNAVSGEEWDAAMEGLLGSLHSVLKDFRRLTESTADGDMTIDMYSRMADRYGHTPEFRLILLKKLAKLYGWSTAGVVPSMEAGVCLIHCAALISEILYASHPDVKGLPAGCGAFASIFPAAAVEKLDNDILDENRKPKAARVSKLSDMISNVNNNNNNVAGLGGGAVNMNSSNINSSNSNSSDPFSLSSLFYILEQAVKVLTGAEMYESANEVVKLMLPMYERIKDNTAVWSYHEKLANIFKMIKIAEESQSRAFGKYYRVGFYGAKFKDELNGKEFVYKQPKLTHLYEVCDGLREKYKEIYKAEVEILKEAGAVKLETLKSDTLYLQITSLEPYFDPSELSERQTSYEKSTNLKRFIYETPFVKLGGAQGSVKDQNIRKTILEVEYPFPYLRTRQAVKSKSEIELTPIEVAIEAIEKQTQKLKATVETRSLLGLLQGSVLLQVNVGPIEFCKVFLADDKSSIYTAEHLEQLRSAFREFVLACEEALGRAEVAATATSPELIQMLQKGFWEMVQTIGPFLQENAIHPCQGLQAKEKRIRPLSYGTSQSKAIMPVIPGGL